MDAGRGLWLRNGFSPKIRERMTVSTQPPALWVRQMNTDPFENFERSRLGWSVPVALFLLGGALTYFAVSSLHGILLREVQAAQAEQGRDVQTANPPVVPSGKGPEDKGPEDKGPEDKGPEDKGPEDKGPEDKGPDGGG